MNVIPFPNYKVILLSNRGKIVMTSGKIPKKKKKNLKRKPNYQNIM
jgi:hypothetical protein